MQEPSVDPLCVQAFNEMKDEQKYCYIVYRLTEDFTKIVVEKTAPANATYEDFKDDMYKAKADKECRYGVFNYEYTYNGQNAKKLIFILWSPESASVILKMRYVSSEDALKKALCCIEKDLQATDVSELDLPNVLAQIMS